MWNISLCILRCKTSIWLYVICYWSFIGDLNFNIDLLTKLRKQTKLRNYGLSPKTVGLRLFLQRPNIFSLSVNKVKIYLVVHITITNISGHSSYIWVGITATSTWSLPIWICVWQINFKDKPLEWIRMELLQNLQWILVNM